MNKKDSMLEIKKKKNFFQCPTFLTSQSNVRENISKYTKVTV